MVGLNKIPGEKFTIGIAYVALPSDIQRADYIADCYVNCHLSVQTEDGGFLNRIPISPEDLSFIEFPVNTNELGSPVVYAVDEKYGHPYIIKRFIKRDELGDLKEGMFKFKRKIDGGFVEVSGSVNDRSLNLLVDGGDKPGIIFVKAFSKNQDCQLDVDVAGDVNVTASGAITTTSHKETTIETIDNDSDDSASIKQTPTETKLYSKKVIVNDGKEPMVLGQKWKDFMGSLIDQIAAITVATAIGVQPILNKVQVMQLKEKLDDPLSQEGFLNK